MMWSLACSHPPPHDEGEDAAGDAVHFVRGGVPVYPVEPLDEDAALGVADSQGDVELTTVEGHLHFLHGHDAPPPPLIQQYLRTIFNRKKP